MALSRRWRSRPQHHFRTLAPAKEDRGDPSLVTMQGDLTNSLPAYHQMMYVYRRAASGACRSPVISKAALVPSAGENFRKSTYVCFVRAIPAHVRTRQGGTS